MRRTSGLLTAAVVGVLATGCGSEGALDPAGPVAERIADVFWLMTGLAAAVVLLVLVLLAVAARRGGAATGEADSPAARRLLVGGGLVLPIAVLGLLFAVNVATLTADAEHGELEIEVVGHQYWWEVRYPTFTTANEIHIPAGEPVTLRLRSADVIHSVWVPRLGGKADLVPGREQTLVYEADEPGTYQGRCLEYCGLQHAWMLFTVVAHTPDDFQRWRDEHAEPAAAPTTEAQERGRQVFMEHSCVGCHTIRGVSDAGVVGPDLTHLGSREELGAGVIENTTTNLIRWIANAQTVKPGVEMPPQSLDREEITALVAYLESLE